MATWRFRFKRAIFSIRRFFISAYYFFPVQLFFLHIKKNQVLLLYWVVLFATITGNFGEVLGIPYLFLDPEYLNEVGFWSFFIMGIVIAGFIMSFNITGYILDGFRFKKLGTLSRPFTKYCINNSLIPLIFIVWYTRNIVKFQILNEYGGFWQIVNDLAGLYSGMAVMFGLFVLYFAFTNKDLFVFLSESVDRQLKKRIKATRGNVMSRYNFDRKRTIRIDHFIDWPIKVSRFSDEHNFYSKYERAFILKVFDQNHLNSVFIQLLIFIVILILGGFRENTYFQIPAAASAILLGTIFMIITGAMSYWFRGWSISFFIGAFLLLNLMYSVNALYITNVHQAYGLNYDNPPAKYNLEQLQKLNSNSIYQADSLRGIEILNNWRAKFPADEPPSMVMVCASGGGLRASLWTYRVLSVAEERVKQSTGSLLGKPLFDQTRIITGASGGLIGAAYYRELYLHGQLPGDPDLHATYLENIGRDLLNPVIFTMVVNNILVPPQYFRYHDRNYVKDRGYAFEKQLSLNTHGLLDKSIAEYTEPEYRAEIPMLVLSPTIINDGRKLYIGAQPISYLNRSAPGDTYIPNEKLKGVDFQALFSEHNAGDLYFPTALRMSASFPYIAPSISLPSDPSIEIMDAGVADNFGISDALRFLYVFKEWIAQNTRQVVIVSIRDTNKNPKLTEPLPKAIVERMFTPISSVYNNFTNIQDINNDTMLEYALSWYGGELHKVDFVYDHEAYYAGYMTDSASTLDKLIENRVLQRASLNWHLTTREKENIIDNIYTLQNQKAMETLCELMAPTK